jgi:hypothetical protein
MPPLPSLSTGTLIAITIALSILALFNTVFTIRRMPLLFVVTRRRGRVVDSSMPSYQPPPVFVTPVAG